MYGIIVDILVIVIILLFAIIGTFRGLFKSLTSLMGVGLAITLTYLLRNQILLIDENIGINNSIANTIGSGAANVLTIIIYGAIIFVLLKILALVLNYTIGKLFESKILSGLNKFFGFLFGLVKGTLISLVFLFLLTGLMRIEIVNDYIRPKMEGSFIVLPVVEYLEDNVLQKFLNNEYSAESPVV